MIEKMQALARQLKKAFPNGYVRISPEVWDFQCINKQETLWKMSISEIGVHEEYKTWEALGHDAHFLLSKQAMGVYNDESCNEHDNDVLLDTAENIVKNMSPWNKFN